MKTTFALLILAASACATAGVPHGTVVSAAEWREAHGTGWTSDTHRLPERAALELRCPEEQLRLAWMGDRSAMVEGCGCRAMYVWAGSAVALNSTSGSCQARVDE